MSETCVVCARPESQGFLCDSCTKKLQVWLYELAGHAVDIQSTVLTNLTSRRGEKVMVRGEGESPMPYNVAASIAREELHMDLWSIVTGLTEDRGTVYPGVDQTAALAFWLGKNVAAIAQSADAEETYDTIRTQAVGWVDIENVHQRSNVLKTVDIPAEMVLLGPCDAIIDGKVCENDVKAVKGATWAKCRCFTVHDVAEFRARVESRMLDSLATEDQLYAHFRTVVRPNMLAVWKHREKFKPHGQTLNGELLYRIGDVKALVDGMKTRREAA